MCPDDSSLTLPVLRRFTLRFLGALFIRAGLVIAALRCPSRLHIRSVLTRLADTMAPSSCLPSSAPWLPVPGSQVPIQRSCPVVSHRFPPVPRTMGMDGMYSLLRGEADLDLVESVALRLPLGARALAAVDVHIQAVTLVTWAERERRVTSQHNTTQNNTTRYNTSHTRYTSWH